MLREGAVADERTRLAATSVLANIDALSREGLDEHGSTRATALARALAAQATDGLAFDRDASSRTVAELRQLLAPLRGITASALRGFLDELDTPQLSAPTQCAAGHTDPGPRVGDCLLEGRLERRRDRVPWLYRPPTC